MDAKFDLVIRNGTVIDGSGQPGFKADIGISGDLISAVDSNLGSGIKEIDARGMIVTPGFVDIHTHYDGQALWEDRLTPSSGHGVTSVVIGNCGVGFAPCRKKDRDRLVELMEGVEDVPGVVMTEGLDWNWESYPQYLDRIEARPHDVNIASYLPHSPLRVYVMGKRAVAGEPARPADIEKMARLTKEAMEFGAIGFATSRFLIHRSSTGEHIPTLEAGEAELQAIADAMSDAGHGVLQVADDYKNYTDISGEFAMLRRIVSQSGRSMTLPMGQSHSQPELWRTILSEIEKSVDAGLPISAQVMPRGIGMILGLEATAHPFALCPSYLAIGHLPLDERVEQMRNPDFRAKLLVEQPNDPTLPLHGFARRFESMFMMGDPPNYEPLAESSIAARAEREGVSPEEVAYDLLLENNGRALLYMPFTNYANFSLDAVMELIQHRDVVPGLGDGGAHYGLICDASYPTFVLSYLTRDRTRGARLPLPVAVKAMSRDTAVTLSLLDRGLIKPGYKADINVIDYDRLMVRAPRISQDLPAGGHRFTQNAEGYVATVVNGVIVSLNDRPTGALPGQLVRGPKDDPGLVVKRA